MKYAIVFLSFVVMAAGAAAQDDEWMASASDAGMVVKQSANDFQTTVDGLRGAIEDRGLGIAATIDHAKAATGAGLEMPDTMVILFGNPKIGTPLMLASPSVSLDLPMKIAVFAGNGGQIWVIYRDPETLKESHGLAVAHDETLTKMGGALNAITDEAVQAQ